MMAQHKVIIIFFCGFNQTDSSQALELGLKSQVTATHTHNSIILSHGDSWFKGANGGKKVTKVCVDTCLCVCRK